MTVYSTENQPLIPSKKCNETSTEDTTKSSFTKILSTILLCVCAVLFCLNFRGKEPTHADSCTAVPSISWSSLHTIPHDRHHLRVGHELTDRLHITNGSVQVHLNEEISETTVRFDLKLTEESQIDLIQMKQVTQSDRIALIVDADTTAEIPLCITLDITIELPSFSALDSLSIETSNTTIDVESGMYFPHMMQLKTTDGNITVKVTSLTRNTSISSYSS
ncbi:hypothetical protein BJV82DRAFT_14477 [Fennellomyces sp. T-0311]|nr:hypothetical protein BJV82DRAFT_14477 [Fennellomyces sp. T-0311]